MVRNIFILSILLFAVACTSKTQINTEDFQVDKYLSEEEKADFLAKIIYKVGKWPKAANVRTVKHEHFAENFEKELRLHRLKYYYPKGDTIYFATWRVAPSIKEKYRMTVGRLIMGEDETLFYEETFRTWKMIPSEMEEKGSKLFTLFLEGKDLTPYYNENSGDEEWIEFPDSETWWDAETERWKSTRMQIMEELYETKQSKMEEILSKKDSTANQ